ncbi:hypothetical protein HanIR_Chr05g0208931 [Helianthus annuus]|nr:hypothetical protein HanIR_Chr05g0208931 [Helianthus annuus]
MFHLTQVTFFADGKYDGGASKPNKPNQIQTRGHHIMHQIFHRKINSETPIQTTLKSNINLKQKHPQLHN